MLKARDRAGRVAKPDVNRPRPERLALPRTHPARREGEGTTGHVPLVASPRHRAAQPTRGPERSTLNIAPEQNWQLDLLGNPNLKPLAFWQELFEPAPNDETTRLLRCVNADILPKTTKLGRPCHHVPKQGARSVSHANHSESFQFRRHRRLRTRISGKF
jgi:hypothetical protein